MGPLKGSGNFGQRVADPKNFGLFAAISPENSLDSLQAYPGVNTRLRWQAGGW
jgi:hypothetical protein